MFYFLRVPGHYLYVWRAGVSGDPMTGVGQDGEGILSDDSDDFVVLRRDVNAGRAVMSGPVLYSVAESAAQPR